MLMLRKVSKTGGIEKNEFLGKRYELLRRDSEPNQFEDCCKKHLGGLDPDCYAFIIGDEVAIPLFEDEFNYIILPGGVVMEDITHVELPESVEPNIKINQ